MLAPTEETTNRKTIGREEDLWFVHVFASFLSKESSQRIYKLLWGKRETMTICDR